MIGWLLLAAQAVPAAVAPPATVAAPPAIAPELHAAAEALVHAAGVDASLKSTLDREMEQMRSGAILSAQLDQNPAIRLQRAKNPQAWDAAIARIGARQGEMFARATADLQPLVIEQAVRTYATSFSLDDLRQLAAFYRSPLGRRLVARTPAIALGTAQWLQGEMARRLAPTTVALAAEVQRELEPLLPRPAPPPPR